MTQTSSTTQAIVITLVELLTTQFGSDLPAGYVLEGTTDLLADLALESVQVMEYMVEVEDHFDVAIELEQLGDVRTVADLAAVVAALVAERS